MLYFSNSESSIINSLEYFAKLSKQGGYDLFFEKGHCYIIDDIIDLFKDESFDILYDILIFLKFLTKCDFNHIQQMLSQRLINFIKEIYRQPRAQCNQCQIFRIYANLMSKSDEVVDQFLDDNFDSILKDVFYKHTEDISLMTTEDVLIAKSILKVLSSIFTNSKLVFQKRNDFLEESRSMIFSLLYTENEGLLLSCLKCIKNATSVNDISIIHMFFYDRYFNRYNEICMSSNSLIRFNMISILCNFCVLDKLDLNRFLASGFFDLDLEIEKLSDEEHVQLLVLMYNLVQFDQEFASNVMNLFMFGLFSRNIPNLTFKEKELFNLINAKILRYPNLIPNLIQSYPNIIQTLAEDLECTSPRNQILIVFGFQSLADYANTNENLDQNVKEVLYDEQFCYSLHTLMNDSTSENLTEAIEKLLETLSSANEEPLEE